MAASLPGQFRAEPDYPEDELVRGLWMGEAGVLLVAHTLAPAADIEASLLDVVRANRDHPSNELAWGAPGTMLAAQVMHERTGDPAWAEAWRGSADDLWEAWDGDLWLQTLRGRARTCSGRRTASPATSLALARGDLLDGAAPRRARAARGRRAREVRDAAGDGLAQWPPALEPPAKRAAGPGRSGATARPASSRRSGRWRRPTTARPSCCVAGGELTWRAGPLAKGAGLCHGTAGNGYAFLKLFERTGDERWLDRARPSPCMHSSRSSTPSRGTAAGGTRS